MKSLVKKYIIKTAAMKTATEYSHAQLANMLSKAQDTFTVGQIDPASFSRAAHAMVNAAEITGESAYNAVQASFEKFLNSKELHQVLVSEIVKSADQGHTHPVTGKVVKSRVSGKSINEIADKAIRGLRAWVTGLGAMDPSSTFAKIDRALVNDISNMVDSLYRDQTSLRSDIEEQISKILSPEEAAIYYQGVAGKYEGFKALLNRVFHTYMEGTNLGNPDLQEENTVKAAIEDVFKQESRKMAPKKAIALLHWVNEIHENKAVGQDFFSKMKAVKYDRKAINGLVRDGINRHEVYLSEMFAPFVPKGEEVSDEYPTSLVEKGVHGVVLAAALAVARANGAMKGLASVCGSLLSSLDVAGAPRGNIWDQTSGGASLKPRGPDQKFKPGVMS